MAKGAGGNGPDIAALLAQVKAGVSGIATAALAGVSLVTREVNAFARSFVEAFRPDVVKRFDLASRDLLATIGEGLVPVMEAGTVIVRALADTLNGLYKATKDIADGGFALLNQIMAEMGPVVKEFVSTVASAWIPVQKQLLQLVKDQAPNFMELVKAIVPVAGAILEMNAALLSAVIPIIGAFVPLMKLVADLIAGLIPIILAPLKMLAAVIGPVMQVALMPLTLAAQLLAAVLGPIVAVIKAVGEGIGEVTTAATALVNDALKAFMDILGELFSVFAGLLDPIQEFIDMLVKGFVDVIRQVVKWLLDIIRQLREALGLPTKDPTDLDGDGKGKAARGAKFGSTDEMWKAVVQATAGAGRGEPVKDIKNDTAAMRKSMDAIAKNTEQMAKNRGHMPATADPKAADLWRNQELRRG